jgi:DivIVA domain-containing protein
MSDWLTAIEARETTFGKPPLGWRGYNEQEVDDFVAQVVARLDGRGGVTAADVHTVAFSKPPLFKRGYNTDEVDAFLQRAEEAIARLDSRR